uniref:Uncharacterized protein n=1 Tax=Caudovirales sp. ct7964 TaxID=2825758 RepID=A0A8S5PG61_9CAUD|nr:MAG TPA: hypothetical protein [Caudovirales sp. ct7964]
MVNPHDWTNRQLFYTGVDFCRRTKNRLCLG